MQWRAVLARHLLEFTRTTEAAEIHFLLQFDSCHVHQL